MQEARWEEAVDILERRAEALANPTERVDVLMQAASLWADKIGDGGSAARGLRARAADRSGRTRRPRIELEQLYRQRKSWVKLVDLLLARTEFAADARLAHPAAGAGGGDLRAAAGRSRQRVRHAAGGLPRGLLERPRRQGAGAPGHGGRQVERADRRLHAGRAGDRRSQAGGRPVGEDRALVRLGAPPRRLRHRLGAAGAAARQRAHRRAAGAGGLLPQAEALGGPGGRSGPPRRVRDRAAAQGRHPAGSWPTPTRRRSATPRRR